MPSPINITTETGVRLDVLPNATIEVNMGGISLLSLADRTATYTNSFSLPRTPTNEAVFQFASQPTRNNRPVINVWITKGLFQRKAVLKVTQFNDNYSATISWDDSAMIKMFSELDFHSLPQNYYVIQAYDVGQPEPSNIDMVQFTSSVRRVDGRGFVPVTYGRTTYKANNAAMTVSSLFARITAIYGYTFSGDMLTNTQFTNTFIFDKHLFFEKYYNVDHWEIRQVKNLSGVQVLPFSKVIKALAQIYLFDIKFTNGDIELIDLSSKLNSTPISLEGFSKAEKKLYSGYLLLNYVNYKTNKEVNASFGGDVFQGDGDGDKVAVSIDSYIPLSFGSPALYNTTEDEALSNTIIMVDNGATVNSLTFDGVTYDNTNSYRAAPLTMTGFYSSILNPVFANPVILEADRYIDPLTADNIMSTRVINSVQLGGRYWVDTMAYNLTTGQSKMTLIKLP